ncbi:hypothetical protein BBP40_001719 [Aspergillus hancockii]|nr:hypothetical protein BBP40_001719 [Aspergillus hancockii]
MPQFTKPLLVFACPPASGHTNPLLPHAAHLIKQGYDVSFIGGAEFEGAIRRIGATFHETENTFNPVSLEEQKTISEGPQHFLYDIEHHFIDDTPKRMRALQTVLENLREQHPGREVIIVQEIMYMGTWPFVLGAPLPKGYDRFPKVINFTTVPVVVSSVDTAPFGPGLPPDSSAEGRKRNAAMYEAMKAPLAELSEYINATYQELGATEKVEEPAFDLWSTGLDVMLQPCSPSLEYPRSDLSPKIRFIGGTPRKETDGLVALPAWWDELEANKQADKSKKVVFVTQGTLMVDYSTLLIPTMQALADRDDIMVVGTLGVKGAKLDSFELPKNARIVDFLVYDAVLPYVDVFVTNGGYGSFMTGVMHGVPMVMAGKSQDKAEVSMRGEWAGIAVNLRTNTPSLEALRDGVDRILTDSKFKARAVEIQRENEELNCVVQLERVITELSS